MTENTPRSGRTTIAPDVLVTIARLSTLSVPGVAKVDGTVVCEAEMAAMVRDR